jgi:hypothetical protein
LRPEVLLEVDVVPRLLLQVVDSPAELRVFGFQIDVLAGERELNLLPVEGGALADEELLQGLLGTDEVLSIGGRTV